MGQMLKQSYTITALDPETGRYVIRAQIEEAAIGDEIKRFAARRLSRIKVTRARYPAGDLG